MNKQELKYFLDEKAAFYDHPDFIASDPIQIPRQFDQKEDIEIAGFLTATISWGNRKSIINNAKRMMELMANSPHDFILNHKERHLAKLETFVHRTFNGTDLITFVAALQQIYRKHGGLEAAMTTYANDNFMDRNLHAFKLKFFEVPHLRRTQKHVSDPLKNSAAKRLHMYLRWMVRPNTTGVDFGLWKTLKPQQLSCPLDVHSGNVARKLGLLSRKQNDAKALRLLDESLRKMAPEDPVKYDFALFGIGAFEKASI
ncbi:TIGR02757 family protein [Croceiramulus getboli]|nr:TIGR02757 family protein [Flavobacteriaceae bacterium YJPT1-3]